MSKADDRAALERLMASFKGETKICPPKAQTNPVKKRRVKKGAPDGRLEAAETAMRTIAAPVVEAKNLTQDGSGSDACLGGVTRYKEADYDVGEGPRDDAHRAFQMPKDQRSRGYVEMMIGADDDDEGDYSGSSLRVKGGVFWEKEKRFRDAAKTAAHCGTCGRALEPGGPVWLLRRKYDSDRVDPEYSGLGICGTDEVVAPVCGGCWNDHPLDDIQTRVSISGPCAGCGRPVHITPKALKSWLAHGKRIYCCEDCAQRPVAKPPAFTKQCAVCGKPFAPKRLDAIYCPRPACRKQVSRKK
jgi:hypothetical protein